MYTMIVFLKDFFENVNLKKTIADDNQSIKNCLSFKEVCMVVSSRPVLDTHFCRERSGSVVECLTRDRGAAGSSLIGVTALWSLSSRFKPHQRHCVVVLEQDIFVLA